MFYTKRELLKFLGKNENDNKLVDRMIKRWEVIRLADGYELVENDTEALKKRIKELEWRIVDGRIEGGAEKGDETNSDDLANDLEYLNQEYMKLEESRERAIRKLYNLMVAKKIFDPEKNTFEDVFNWAIE